MKIINMGALRAGQLDLTTLSAPERKLHVLMVKALGDRELVPRMELAEIADRVVRANNIAPVVARSYLRRLVTLDDAVKAMLNVSAKPHEL
jgi:hypothetical protein